MSDLPSNPELIAAAIGLLLAGRQSIQHTDRTNFQDVNDTLDALHEHLAVAGGSLLYLADDLGCREEVDRLVANGQSRLNAFRASQGLGGRA